MRIFTALLSTESNSFSPVPTNRQSYLDCFYAPPGSHPDHPRPTTAPLWVLRQRAPAAGWTVIEGSCAHAEPAAPTTREAYEGFREEILDQLRAALPVDAVILGLHGAMIAQGYDDCEGDLLTRVRSLVGPGVPVGAALDPHCHLTAAMLAAADALIAYKEFPHTDFVERAEELVEIVTAAAAGRIRPVMAAFDCRMIITMPTTQQPMRGFVDRLKALEGRDGILSISAIHCFPYGDVADIGARMLVIADGDRAKAEALAARLGREIYALRGRTMPAYLSPDAAIDQALAGEGGTYVLADPADNAGGGAPSDNTTILRRLIERGVTGAALGPLWDPQAVRFAFAVGLGGRLAMRIGGKTGAASGLPVDAEVEVIGLARDASQRFAGARIPLGDCAGLRIGGVEVVVNALRTQARSPDLFANVGIDPAARRILVVKSTNHFHAAFAPIAREVLYVESDGPLARDHRRVPYTRITRPMWPFVADPLAAD
ncbi:MAG: M81 family metallopeptidase [Thalassobaculales bacterium]